MDKLGLGGEIEETKPMKVGKLIEPYLKMFVPRPGSILYSDPDFISVGRAGCSPDLTLLSEEVGDPGRGQELRELRRRRFPPM
jgi:hypothetical protein